MSAVLVDSSIFIASWRGDTTAHAFLLRAAPDIRLHPVVEAELLCGARDAAHLREITTLLDLMPRVAIKNADMTAAIGLLRTHYLSQKIGWADCVIAATCLRLGLRLATLNAKHFRVIRGLRTQQPT
jgi:predicted nucleic acid-binding protein